MPHHQLQQPSVHLVAPRPRNAAADFARLEWIQGLRGIACILVVLTHARYFMLDTPNWALADALFLPGASGVDLFFAISGFIMAYTTRTYTWRDAPHFFARRIARVWPPYAVMTVIWIFALGAGWQALHMSPGLADIGRSLLFIPVSAHKPPYFDVTLPVGWTLQFEVYFYFIFAVSMLFSRYRWIALLTWIVASVLVLPLSERGFQLDPRLYTPLGWSYLSLMSNSFILEFLIGVIAAAIYLSRLRIASERLCWNLLFLVVSWSLWSFSSKFYDFHGPLNWGIPVAACMLTLALVSKTIRLQLPAPLLWLGTISYSLYLTHLATQQLMVRYFQAHSLDTHSWSFIFVTSCTACVVGWVFYEAIEVRLCRYLQRRLSL